MTYADLKCQAFSTAVEFYPFATIRVHKAVPGVHLPDEVLGLAGETIHLELGFHMAVPIPDLAFDEEGIRATLSFNRTPHYCIIPWGAVTAIQGGADFALQFAKPEVVEAAEAPAPAETPAKPARGGLRLV